MKATGGLGKALLFGIKAYAEQYRKLRLWILGSALFVAHPAVLAMQMQKVRGGVPCYQCLLPECSSALQLILTRRDHVLRLPILGPEMECRRIVVFEFGDFSATHNEWDAISHGGRID
jgi:hypothetical protein